MRRARQPNTDEMVRPALVVVSISTLLGVWVTCPLLQIASASSAARKLHSRREQFDLAPDFASRRRIRDVEADAETLPRLLEPTLQTPGADDVRFLETAAHARHRAAAAAAAAVRDPPDDEPEAPDKPESDDASESIKAKLLMEAESLGISRPERIASKIEEAAVDAEQNVRSRKG